MSDSGRSSLFDKARLLARVSIAYAKVIRLSRRPLPEQMEELKRGHRSPKVRYPPHRIGRAIHRGLRIGSIAPRCLPKAQVMFSILYAQGDQPELVIGLPPEAPSHEAHAWIEIDTVDVGPPPGRAGREELVRYS